MTASHSPGASRNTPTSTMMIIEEMLEHARETGATKVNIEIDHQTVCITDDGSGIENPASILPATETHPHSSQKSGEGQETGARGFHALGEPTRAGVVESLGPTLVADNAEDRKRWKIRPWNQRDIGGNPGTWNEWEYARGASDLLAQRGEEIEAKGAGGENGAQAPAARHDKRGSLPLRSG